MKDLFIVIIITVVLSAVFSIFGPFSPSWDTAGLNPRHLGDRGLALPGGGDTPAELTPEISEYDLYEQTKTDVGETEPGMREVENKVTGNVESELLEEKEQERNMNEIVVAFWHGVAAVLIGETCALALALILVAKWLHRK